MFEPHAATKLADQVAQEDKENYARGAASINKSSLVMRTVATVKPSRERVIYRNRVRIIIISVEVRLLYSKRRGKWCLDLELSYYVSILASVNLTLTNDMGVRGLRDE